MSQLIANAWAQVIWWMSGIRRKRSHPVRAARPPQNSVLSSPPAQDPLLAKKAKPRKSPVKRQRTISETLDGLDSSFAALRKADYKRSLTCKTTIKALRKLGPFVPPPEYMVNVTYRPPNTKDLPSLVFVATRAFFTKENDKKDILSPAYFYAKKCATRPAACQYISGVIYECGQAFEDKDKLAWHFFFVAIKSDGSIVPVRYRYPKTIQLPNRGCFVRRESGFGGAEHWAAEQNKPADQFLSNVASMCFSFWSMKDQMWRVSAKKGGQRMNFAIDTHETKHYFKDRDRQGVCTSSGRLKPIAHYVSEHDRNLANGSKSVVKEHIRGLRQFDWNGYAIKIQSPKFGGVFADSFTGSAIEDEDAEVSKEKLVSIDVAVDRLVRMEEAA